MTFRLKESAISRAMLSQTDTEDSDETLTRLHGYIHYMVYFPTSRIRSVNYFITCFEYVELTLACLSKFYDRGSKKSTNYYNKT